MKTQILESEAKLKFLGEFEGDFFQKAPSRKALRLREGFQAEENSTATDWKFSSRFAVRFNADIESAVEFSAKTATRLFAGIAGKRRCQTAKRGENFRERLREVIVHCQLLMTTDKYQSIPVISMNDKYE